jgi:hypothetical protein
MTLDRYIEELLKRAPLARWVQWQAFDTAEACEREVRERMKISPPGLYHARDIAALCIASDDRRLR